MNFLFLMKPLETVHIEKDTSFAFMLGAFRRGHNIYYLPTNGISVGKKHSTFHALPIEPHINPDAPFVKAEEVILNDDQVDAIFIRTDPPFDQDYLMKTWLLDRISKRIFMINNPSAIRMVNEKIWATQFSGITPATLITARKDSILKFLKQHHKIVIKPTDGFGGSSIFTLTKDDLNINVILETMTKNWTTEIIVQEYLNDAERGDKRILLLNGEPLGAVLRLHSDGETRNNFFTGGKALSAEITENDYKIIDHIKAFLKKHGLYFVGIDIIGNKLTEINVTSPTCLQEMNQLYHVQLEDRVIDFVEKNIERCQNEHIIEHSERKK